MVYIAANNFSQQNTKTKWKSMYVISNIGKCNLYLLMFLILIKFVIKFCYLIFLIYNRIIYVLNILYKMLIYLWNYGIFLKDQL